MADNVYYLQSEPKRKVPDTRPTYDQLAVAAEKLKRKNKQLKTECALSYKKIAELRQLLEHFQQEIELLNTMERALSQKKSENAILKFVARHRVKL